MDDARISGPAVDTGSRALRDALRLADLQREQLAPMLRHLLGARDGILFSDAVLARVRAMVTDLSAQLLRVQAEATGEKARDRFVADHGAELSRLLLASEAVIAHCHAVALEWQLTLDLETRLGIDPVLAPLLQRCIGSERADVAASAMGVLAAQTRYVQHQRRMDLPLAELDGERFHEVLKAWRAFAGQETSDALQRAEQRLRSDYDEGRTRLAKIARLIACLGDDEPALLNLPVAGLALFLSAVASRSDQARSLVVISTGESQIARLVLLLRASGMRPADIDAQILAIHPDTHRWPEVDALGTREAASWLERGGMAL